MRPRPGVSEPAACRHVFHVGQFDHGAEVGAGREERAKLVGTVDGGGFVIRKSRPEPRRSQLGTAAMCQPRARKLDLFMCKPSKDAHTRVTLQRRSARDDLIQHRPQL